MFVANEVKKNEQCERYNVDYQLSFIDDDKSKEEDEVYSEKEANLTLEPGCSFKEIEKVLQQYHSGLNEDMCPVNRVRVKVLSVNKIVPIE